MHFPRKIEENITDTKNNIRFSVASPFYDFKNQSILFSIVSGKGKKNKGWGKDPHTSNHIQVGTVQNLLEASSGDDWLITII